MPKIVAKFFITLLSEGAFQSFIMQGPAVKFNRIVANYTLNEWVSNAK